MTEISFRKLIKRSDQFMSSDLGDAIVLSDIGSDKFFGTNKVGARVWELLEKPVTIADLCDQLMQQFNVDREQCEQHVSLFVQELLDIKAVSEA